MRNELAKKTAIGGVLAALAVVIMCMGGIIPVATYVCAVLCMLLGNIVLQVCGSRFAWAWYGTVAVLSLLLGPDKEAAAVYLFLGYYPILKRKFDKFPLPILWKLIYFNVVIIVLYSLLIQMFGLTDLMTEFSEFGYWGLAVILLLGNVTFFLTDFVLGRFMQRRRRR